MDTIRCGSSNPPNTRAYDSGLVCRSPTAPTPTVQVWKITSRPAFPAVSSSARSIARTDASVVTASFDE
ncbi:hypothetical protein [Micromonospora fulviviridis]|uniref:Uncharacterized protein n=1 Tax=Micromonospora fulviviridis TaxID=47860 RepID=A0ABV2VUQ3_9ACTN